MCSIFPAPNRNDRDSDGGSGHDSNAESGQGRQGDSGDDGSPCAFAGLIWGDRNGGDGESQESCNNSANDTCEDQPSKQLPEITGAMDEDEYSYRSEGNGDKKE